MFIPNPNHNQTLRLSGNIHKVGKLQCDQACIYVFEENKHLCSVEIKYKSLRSAVFLQKNYIVLYSVVNIEYNVTLNSCSRVISKKHYS